MGESLAVYSFLAFIMMFCGGVMAYRYPARHAVKCNVTKRRNGKERVDYIYSYQTKDSFSKAEIWVPILTFAVIFGCRWYVGVDYPHYLAIYRGFGDKELEPLFYLLTHGLSFLGFHFAFYFTTIAFLEVFFLYYAFRKYKYLYPFLAFFLIVGFWFLSLNNILRQQLAACFFLISIPYIIERKPLKYFTCVLVAFLFHKSAVVLVFLYPVFRWKTDWFKNIYVQIGLFAVAVFLSTHYELVTRFVELPFTFFSNKFGYSQYSMGFLTNDTLNNRKQFGRGSGFGLYAQIIKFLPLIIYNRKMKVFFKDTFFNVAYSCWFVGVLTIFAFGNSIILTRPFIYLQNFQHILPAFFFYYCWKMKKWDTTVVAVIMVMLYVLLFINLISNGIVNTAGFNFFWQYGPDQNYSY